MPPPSAHARCRSAACRSLTLVETLAIVAIALILIAIFMFMLPHMRHRPMIRTVCSSNLRGIGTGLYTYANENNDMFPVVAHARADQEGIGRVTYVNKIGTKRTGIFGVASAPSPDNPTRGGSTETDTELSTIRNLWVLVRTGASLPGSFICPTSDDTPNDEDNPQDFFDFRKYAEISYGYQVPYGLKGQPSPDLNQNMPLAADKGPFGAAFETGQPHPGVPNILPDADPGDWMRWNSANHGGEGQNVLYADSHAEFQPKPTCGIDNDNIYTRWAGGDGFLKVNEAARSQGLPPAARETPWSDTDTLIYP